MPSELSWETIFHVEYADWAIRNLIVNYFVYIYSNDDDELDIQKLHDFVRTHSDFGKKEVYQAEIKRLSHRGKEIFDETTLRIDETHFSQIESIVEEEYGLRDLIDPEHGYTVANFLWNAYHNFGYSADSVTTGNKKKGKKPWHSIHGDHGHILHTIKGLFQTYLGNAISAELVPINNHPYLVIEWEGENGIKYRWPIRFQPSAKVFDNENFVAGIWIAFKDSYDPSCEFPTICSPFFGTHSMQMGQQAKIQLVQVSSLMKLFHWLQNMQKRNIAPNRITRYFHLILQNADIPLSVGHGIAEIERHLGIS